MIRACLVNPPWEQDGAWGIRAGCRFPNLMPRGHNSYVPFPFLLAYTAAFLQSHGHEVLLIDGVAERSAPASVIQRVVAFGPHLILAETSTTSFRHDLAVMEQLRSALPRARTAIYGPHVSALPRDALASHAVDYVIVGEPEETSLDLARGIEQGEVSPDLPGLALRDGQAEHRVNPRRPLISDLDALPYPLRHGLPMQRYSVPGFPSPVVFMYASRGCPFRCTYCLWPQTVFEPGRYRARSAAAVVTEMRHVMTQFPQTRSFFFDDDTFNLGRQRLRLFADELERSSLQIPWGMNARADHWDQDILKRLLDVGLFTLRIGIESGDQEVLNRARKDLDLAEARRALWMAHRLGIRIHVSFMVGLAGESETSIARTLAYIRSIPAASVQFSVAVPFPGTAYHAEAREKGLLMSANWDDYSGSSTAVMRTESLTADQIMEALSRMRRRVYFSPRFLWSRLGYIRSGRDFLALARKAGRLLLPRKRD